MPDQPQRFDTIGTRGIIGMFFLQLEQLVGQSWMDKLCNAFQSNQDTETYTGIGMVPQMREWIGSKQAKGFNEFALKITNRNFEATLAIKKPDLRRDKTAQLNARIGQLAQRAVSHESVLLSALINTGNSTTIVIPGSSNATIACYDGQPLFSASHLIGSTALNNSITFSIGGAATTLGTAVGAGSTTNPSPAAFSLAIQAALSQLYAFQDDQLQPLNEFAREFIIMVPPSLSGAATQAVKGAFMALGYSNPLMNQIAPSEGDIKFTVIPNPRLTWTNQFAMFRTDSSGFKPLIRQVEALEPMPNMSYGEEDGIPVGFGLTMTVLAEGSDHAFKQNEHLYSVEKSGFVGVGCFDQAILCQFVS